MSREIRLSKRASLKLDKLLIFLEEEWSLKAKKDFLFKLDASLVNIQKLPASFPESKKIPGLRKCVVTRQTSIFYKYSDSTIYIVSLFDNRQNPKSLVKEINTSD
jgi:plasmid stabilization system protein ParE